MEVSESQDFVVIVVEVHSESVDESDTEIIKENVEDQSLLLENIKTEKWSPEDTFDVTVKIENNTDELTDIEANKNIFQDFLSRKASQSIVNPYLNADCLVKEETQNYIQVKTEPSLLTNQKDVADTKKCFYGEDLPGNEHEVEYLEEEYNDDCIPKKNVKNRRKKILPQVNTSYNCKKHLTKVSYSYIRDLQLQFPELKKDEELFVEVLTKIMKEVKAPPLPEKYYEQNYNEFNCTICGATTCTLPAAERHYLEKHGSRYLVCYACGDTFRCRTNLYKHEKRCKAKDIDIVLKARAIFLGGKGQNRPYLNLCKRKVQTVNSRKYHCTMCPAVYHSKPGLESHINKHLGRRPYRCDKCSNAYTCQRGFQRHYEKHENPQYICDTCNRSFQLKETLIVHMDTHLPIKKYGCAECDRRYAKKYALDIHVNTVHRQLPHPYRCQICSKRYPRLSKLKDHMKKEHGLNIMSRNMFLKKLPTLSDEDVLNAKVVMVSDHILVNQDPYILD